MDYAMYRGIWKDTDGRELVVEPNEDGDEVRFTLYNSDNIEASGFIQYSQEYEADYFYNEHDGIAHHSWFDEDGTMHIDSFGTFTYVSRVDEDTTADSEAENTLDEDSLQSEN